MAELFENAQKLNVRICNKYDIYSEWLKSSTVLGEGELAVCVIDSGDDTGLTPPAVGFKFGNGKDVFKDLDWAQATAGDVHGWAKKSTPDFADLDDTYKNSLKGYINQVTANDTNTQYTYEFADDKLIIKSFELGAEDVLSPVAEFELGIAGKVAKVVGATAGHVAIMTEDGQIADGAIALDDLATDQELADAIAPLATKQELADEKAALNEAIQGVANSAAANLEEIGKLKTADQNLQVAIDGKVAKVNGVAGNVVAFGADGAIVDTNIVAANVVETSELEAAIAPLALAKDVEDSLAEVDEAIQGVADDVAEALEAIGVLNGEAEGSVKKQVADAIAGVVASAPEDFDTLKEIADYIASDKTGAAELSNRVAAVETTLNAEDSGLIDQVAVLNEKAHEHTNKGVIDGISAEQVTAWDAAVQSISGVEATKTGTDVKVTAVSTDLFKQGAKTLVFNCGTASTVI